MIKLKFKRTQFFSKDPGKMRFLLSVTILSVFLTIMLQVTLNFKYNPVLQGNYRPSAKVIISEENASKSEFAEPAEKISINDDLPKLYQERRNHVENICESHQAELERDYKRFQPHKTWKSVVTAADVFHSRNKVPFLWCRVPKAASQSWKSFSIVPSSMSA